MKISRRVSITPVVAILALGLMGLTASRVQATGMCPPNVDLCVVVNSNASTNDRDAVVTLPEALLIANGQLPVSELTSDEQGQVVTMPPGWGPPPTQSGASAFSPPGFGGPGGIGGTSIYFDPDIFCDTCQSKTIILNPPGFGGPGGIGGRALALPVLGDNLGSPIRLGMGYRDGAEVPVTVIIDGSRLAESYDGLKARGDQTWVRGLTLSGFGGTALITEGNVLVGSDNNGLLDAAEAMTFTMNGTNVTALP